jgi:hypothetical protein
MMYLDLLTCEDYASHLLEAGVKNARYAQVTETKGGKIPYSTVTFRVTAPASDRLNHYIIRFDTTIWRGPSAFGEDEADNINACADELAEKLRQLGLILQPGVWSLAKG